MLTKLSLGPLLDQEFEGRHRAEHVLNSEVSYVWYYIGWIMKTFDYISRVVLTLPLSVYEGTWTTLSPLVAMHHHGVCVGNFLKITTLPNKKGIGFPFPLFPSYSE